MATIISPCNEIYSLKNELNTKLYILCNAKYKGLFINYFSSQDNLTIFLSDYKSNIKSEEYNIWNFRKMKESDILSFWLDDDIDYMTMLNIGFFVGKKPIIIGVDKESKFKDFISLSIKLLGYNDDLNYDIERHIENINKCLFF